uniref:4-aminobutyrate aminotransferase, mitochondrial-like n=1 Tax=Saccoglossus kowalevskii TaxID=10224 RepID=A0ABM0H1H0_SACKO|nr:PREDICTED: 4-aminobutyrate aminotransferase, mitochondrial-like [Saccoglossus kowalevskii]
MLTGGYYYTDEMTVDAGLRVFNTWMGDPGKVILLGKVIETINKDKLLKNVQQTGEYLLENIQKLQDKYSKLLKNTRGIGTFCAVDAKDVVTMQKIMELMRNKGVQMGSCGAHTIRFRPTLVFQKHHVDIVMKLFDEVLQDLAQ